MCAIRRTVRCIGRKKACVRSKGDEWMEKNFPKILSAVYETAGEVLYYDGSLVEQPLFFFRR